jgi:poly-gamma-glutamate capsule biosynthesis protein CapA/YwtB (metallophosphatase superfamily)
MSRCKKVYPFWKMALAKSVRPNTTMEKKQTARLLAVGDIYFNRTDLDRPYQDIEKLLCKVDIRFCNYEAAFTSVERPLPGRALSNVPLKSPPSNIRALEDGHFDFISLANNHVLDYGTEALEETLIAFEELYMAFGGAGRTIEHALNPTVIVRQGIYFGFLAFASAFPPSYMATSTQAGIAPIRIHTSYVPDFAREAEHPGRSPAVITAVDVNDIATMEDAVCNLKRRVDHVIVSYHWGVPGRHDLVDYQRSLGHATIDAGASIVLGHHAHNLQAVEAYKRGVIIYGLSQLIFDLPALRDYGFSEETVAAIIELNASEVRSVAMIPLIAEDFSTPRLPSSEQAKHIFELLRQLSAPLGTELSWNAEDCTIYLHL